MSSVKQRNTIICSKWLILCIWITCIFNCRGQTVRPRLNELCSPSNPNSTCEDPNAKCLDDGSNSGLFRCGCDRVKFAPYQTNYDQLYNCGEILSPQSDPVSCQACVNNGGTCVRQRNSTATFCQCPVSLSDVNCNKTNVNILCQMGEMTMCYEPHVGVNISEGWRVYANSMSSVSSCVASTVLAPVNTTMGTNSSQCPVGNQMLKFNLNDTMLAQCGTRKSKDAYNVIYSNKITVELPLSVKPNQTGMREPFNFNIYCSFTAYKDDTFSGLGVGRINGNDRGTQVNPRGLELLALLPSGSPVQSGMYFRTGDNLMFRINMAIDDGNYNSMEILRCTASTSPVIPDSLAETRMLINDGCPLETEPTKDSWYFYRNTNAPATQFSIQTGSVPIFKFTKSDFVYIHCSLKLCIKGDNTCQQYTAASCKNKTSTVRAKRSMVSFVKTILPVDPQDVPVSRTRRATDPSAPGSADVLTGIMVRDGSGSAASANSGLAPGTPGFIALIVGAVLLILLLIAILIIATLNRQRAPASSEQIPHQPQLFALPRIQRTHKRL